MIRRLSLIHFFVTGVVLLAIGLAALSSWDLSSLGGGTAGAALVLFCLGLLSEASGFRLRHTHQSRTSIAHIPFLAAILLLGPPWAGSLAAAVYLVVDTLRRKPPIKIAFNSAKAFLSVSFAGYVFLALGGIPSVEFFEFNFAAFVIAVLVYFPLDQGGTAAAIALSTSTRFREAWGRVATVHQVYDFASSAIALLFAFLYVQWQFMGALLVVVPLLLVRHVYSMSLKLEEANLELLELMVKSIEARDPYTSGHSLRVSTLARAVAEEMGLSSRRIDSIATAALLHDVGKIYEEFAPILRKESKLTPEEMDIMQTHPARGADLIQNVNSLRGEVENAVRYHHEAYSGEGYPDGLAGEEIPLAARIIAVVDTFDAMTTTRPYRKARKFKEAFEELNAMSGRQFDPDTVDVFCNNKRISSTIDEISGERMLEGERIPTDDSAPSQSDYIRPTDRPKWRKTSEERIAKDDGVGLA